MEGTAPVAEATSAILDNYTLNKQESKASNMNSKPGSAKSQTSSSLPEAGEEADDDQTMVIKALDVSLLPIKKWGEEKIQSGNNRWIRMDLFFETNSSACLPLSPTFPLSPSPLFFRCA